MKICVVVKPGKAMPILDSSELKFVVKSDNTKNILKENK